MSLIQSKVNNIVKSQVHVHASFTFLLHADSDAIACTELSDTLPSSDEEDVSSESPPAMRPALQTPLTDVTQVIDSSSTLSTNTRHNLLSNHLQPPVIYSFLRCSSTGRSFQHRWLQTFPWLVYSQQKDGSFCLPCVLFAHSGYQGSSPGILVSRPLTNFKKARETLTKHADKEYHHTTIVRAEEFKSSVSGQQLDIHQRLSKSLADQISTNRQKLVSIMKTHLLWATKHSIAWPSRQCS